MPSADDGRLTRGVSANTILAFAQPLLSAVSQLRSTLHVPRPADIRQRLTQAIMSFERDTLAAGVEKNDVIAARYVLCTFLDEAAATTPWGSGGTWARDPLLVHFHNESWGGEKVFLLLSRLAEQPKQRLALLELIYACLSLGFEGKYRVVPGGAQQLEQLRERLFQLIRQHSPATERSLSAKWQPARVAKRRMLDGAPLWALAAIAAMMSLGAYFVYGMLLANASDPVFASINSIRLASQAPPPPPTPAAKPRLAQLLAPEVQKGLVAVRDDAMQSVVTITGDTLFEPGSAQLTPSVLAIVERVGQSLAQFSGQVLVTGHTDSQPIRTARFPSNWNLSDERARAVTRELGRTVPPERLKAEGHADSEPIADNTTPAGRARNRRVEITLLVGR